MKDYVAFFEHGLRELSKCKIIYDLGGGKPFQKGMSKYKPWFYKNSFKTVDYDSRTEPDIVGDIHNLTLKSESADGVLCMSVLEHISNPHKAVSEIHRVLRPGGILLG